MHLEWYQLCTFLGRLEKIFTQIFSVVCGAKMRNPAGKSCLGASHRDCLCCFPTSFLPSLPKALNTPSHVPAHLTSESCGCFGRGKLYLSRPLKKGETVQTDMPASRLSFLIVRDLHVNCSPQFE